MPSGYKAGAATALNHLGLVAREQGDLATARGLLEESVALRRELGNPGELAHAARDLASVAVEQADLARAAALLEESMCLLRGTRDQRAAGLTASVLSRLAGAEGRWTQAARLLGAAEALLSASELPLLVVHRRGHDRAAAAVRAALGPTAQAAALTEGRVLTLEELHELALGRAPDRSVWDEQRRESSASGANEQRAYR